VEEVEIFWGKTFDSSRPIPKEDIMDGVSTTTSVPVRNLSEGATPRFFVPKPLSDPSYLKVYGFEKNFEFDKWRSLLGENWMLSVYASVIYVTLIFAGKKWMRDRKPYELRGFLFFWNVLLASFSIFGFFRVFPEIQYLLGFKNGFHTSVCFRWECNKRNNT
jgi:hypothetical protein